MKFCCETASWFGVICKDCNKPTRRAGAKLKNLCAKRRPADNPYEVWQSADGWTWNVLKKYQADDQKPGARWFCQVCSPVCPNGDYGDVYVSEIRAQSVKTL